MNCIHLGPFRGLWNVGGVGHRLHQCRHPAVRECVPAGGHPTVRGCEGCALRNAPREPDPLPVDIVITSHNYGHFLPDALESLDGQQALGSVIVVDDASDADDPTRAICETRGVRYLRVEVRSPHLARGAGFAECRSPLVCFLDADNTLPSGYLFEAAKLFAADPRLAIVYPSQQCFGEHERLIEQPEIHDPARFERLNTIDTGAVWSAEAIRQVQPYRIDPAGHEDWFTAREILRSGPWSAKRNPLALNYRQHGSNRLKVTSQRSYYELAGLDQETVTIFTTFSQRIQKSPELWERRKAWLRSQTWPSVRLAVANTSHEPLPDGWSDGLPPTLAGLSWYDHPVGVSGLEDQNRITQPQTEPDVQTAVAAIFNRMWRETSTECVLVLEDDVFPEPPDTIERLMRTLDQHVCAASGAYKQRYFPYAWTLWDRKQPNQTRPSLRRELGEGIEQIGGSGFGCLLLRRSQVAHEVLTGNTPRSRYYDADWFLRLAEQGLEARGNWTVICDHAGEKLPPPLPGPQTTITDRVNIAIRGADNFASRLTADELAIEGMSSPKVRHFLRNLAAQNYLEVGSWKGSTVRAAGARQATCIDNWSGFGGPRTEFIANTSGLPVTLTDADAGTVDLKRLPNGVDVFFYDGDHGAEATEYTIRRMLPLLAREAALVVDDSNMPGVVDAALRAVHGLTIVRRWDLPAAYNGDVGQWWNGLLVLALRREENVGDKLHEILTECGIKRPTCGECEKWRRRMNEWGVDGSENNRAAILKRLNAEASSPDVKWWNKFAEHANVAMRGYISVGALLDEAIKRAAQ